MSGVSKMKTKLLFLCSANVDRSPCAESLFDKSEKYEARSAGLPEFFAEKIVNSEDVEWADIVFVMTGRQKTQFLEKFPDACNKDIQVLGISNDFCRHDKELERLLRGRLGRGVFCGLIGRKKRKL